MTNLDQLFASMSKQLGSRVTPENFRTMLKDISSIRGISNKDRDFIITEMLAYLINEKIHQQPSD